MIEDKNSQEIDLSGMLKNSNTVTEFQDERPWSQTPRSNPPKIVQWAVKYSRGLIKDEKQASYVIWGFVALAMIISLFLFFGGGGIWENSRPDPNSPDYDMPQGGLNILNTPYV